MISVEVLWLEPSTKPLLKAADAKASAVRFHAGLFPDRIADVVYFGVAIDAAGDRFRAAIELRNRLRAVRDAGCGVYAAIGTQPVLGNVAVGQLEREPLLRHDLIEGTRQLEV